MRRTEDPPTKVCRRRALIRHPVAATVLLLIGILLSSSQAFAQEPPPFEPQFDHSACPYDLNVPSDVTLTCGFVTVLENRATHSGKTIELYVVRIEGKRRFLNRDPIIYLAGGPGGSATRAAQYFIDDANFLYMERDLVLFDQRGIGGSKPRLECPDYRQDLVDTVYGDLDPDEKHRSMVDALLACKRTLTKDRGIDLSVYTSASTAADVADVASAMGYESFNLYGSSYGTLLALTIMRDFPEGIRSVVLDGVLPLQAPLYETVYAVTAEAFSTLFRHCETDSLCSERYPSLEETFWSAVERYNDDPFTLSHYDRYSEKEFQDEFDGSEVIWLVASSLRSESRIPYLPFLINEIAVGNRAVADGWSRPIYRGDIRDPIDNTAAYWSMTCYSFGSSMDENRIAADRAAHPKFVPPDTGPPLAPALCDRWNSRPVDLAESQAVVSDIPTLLLSGQFDPATPPEWAELAAETLSNSFSFVLPMTGHGVGIDTPCGQTLVAKFLESPQYNPMSPCVESRATQFADIYLNRGLRMMDTWHWDSDAPLIPETMESLLNRAHLYVTLSVIIVWPLLLLYGLLRRGSRSVLSRQWLARFIAAAALFATWVFTVGILENGATTDELVRNFGYFSWVRPWFIVPYLVWAATALVLYLTLRAWWERWWSLIGRVHYTLALLALAWWLERLVRWDFIGL